MSPSARRRVLLHRFAGPLYDLHFLYLKKQQSIRKASRFCGCSSLCFFTPIKQITFTRLLSISCMNLLAALSIRMIYRYCFKCGTADTRFGKFLRLLLRVFSGEELFANPAAAYAPPVLH